MKSKYATLIRNLLQSYHAQATAIDKENFSVHSDGIHLMELNLQLAKCLEGISATARFNNDVDDFAELHKITLMAFKGDIPTEDNIPVLSSLASGVMRKNNSSLKAV
ncbi:hypothetical protein M9Y43_001263 [Salmonella enterica]|uniref:hypothetical protein n=1 Tax=Salmonella enterica TaxID=28901 RepID=UPI00077986EB|nr:hypothetical protein [Salmonella enterica]HCJ7356143.1 hypothetical protein [Citrobacter freundii]EAU9827878.1 hypothetical protein [Salmonella enterica]EBD2073450.1 hypothetical protein [Salmonella enterica subsp. enterica serovar Typhimurium]EBD2087445.1 hypothetical protein [Salmonella enterica subsp. enterica serovar Typhimurium]EGU4104884.1 hypothetical protein [Salmonella enterica]